MDNRSTCEEEQVIAKKRPNLEYMKDIPNWEKEYLSMGIELNKRQKELLEGAKIKAHEGMMYGEMYSDWKRRKD